MSFSEFRLIAPPHAPLTPTGALNPTLVEEQAKLFGGSGINGVFVSGSTGECTSLTHAERRTLAEWWVSLAGEFDLDVLIQVGDNCQRDAARHAAHAQEIGADGVAAFAPSYLKPESVDDLIAFLEPVGKAAGDLPFYFYDIPTLTHVTLSMVEFLRRGKQRIPNLVGLKYTNSDLVQLQECIQLEDGQYEILFGCDEALLAGAALGARGAVGSTYNFAAPLYRGMLAALGGGNWNEARRLQASATRMIRVFQKYGFHAACKAAMRMLDVDCGPVRPPLRALTDEDYQALRAELRELGMPHASQTPITLPHAPR